MPAVTALPPLVKSVLVAASQERAFELFTAGMGRWWPLLTHSVGGETATSVALDCRVGGQIVETDSDGSNHVWGTLTECSPPTRLTFTWHPGQPVPEATLVTVTFRPDDGQTEVQLVHSGWDSRRDGARARNGYDTGWDIVLAPLASWDVSAQS